MAKLSNICINLIEERLADLDQAQAFESDETIHQLRVLTKQLRAAWHLVQPVCGKKTAKQRRVALRKLSAMLAESRDQSVQHALREKFYLDHPEVSKESLNALFISSSPDSSHTKSASIANIRQALETESAAWSKVRLGDDERFTLRCRWRHSQKQAKARTLETIKSNDPELWHSWRKAIKRLRYQREFLAEINPRKLGKKDLRIRRLGTRLGDHNDLAVFSRQLDSATLGNVELNHLKKIVAVKNREIKRNCRRLGRKLFGK
ncbi:MAG: CHAD domain-containing protein [Verrucomicrobia bacterium]|nr:CHAD domain-containing protein [Verrucomicrobiota bacterium]